MDWTSTKEGFNVWCEIDTTAVYSWEGPVFNNLINGNGVLTISHGSVSETYNIQAYYGALSKSNAICANDDEAFVGKVCDGKYSGLGALIKGSDVYVGNFFEGKPSGDLTLYRSGTVYYSGQWLNGTFDGEGTLYKEDGSIKSGIWKSGTLISADVEVDLDAGRYEGYVFNGKPDGFGKLSYKNKTEYEGEWKDGVWNGIGQYTTPNDTIVSEWANGKANGSTVYSFDNFQYEGQFIDDFPSGNGTLCCSNSDGQYLYAGEWDKGQRSGYGDAIYPNGDAYYGEWKDDAYNGIGRYRFASGDAYDGEWKNNLPNGQGQYISSSFKYSGDWLEGWIHGFGRIDYSNGDIYEGDFCQGKKTGQGIYQYANGNVYEGEFYEDQINGLGVFTFADGNRYEGEFQNGKILGNGTLYYADSTGIVTLTAFWDKPNEFPKEASIIFPNGDCYEGPLENGEPTSEGVWFSIDPQNGQERFIDKISGINDYYKEHRETFNKVVLYTSIALTAIDIAATFAAPMTGGASLAVSASIKAIKYAGQFANVANKVINVVDITTAISSAGIDFITADTEEEQKSAAMDLTLEVGMNAVMLVAPKVLKSEIVQTYVSKLSTSAKSAARKSLMSFSKTKPMRKIISVVKNKEKKLVLAFEKSKVGRKLLRATGRPEYQYVTNKQVSKIKKNNPNITIPEYNPNSVGDGKILGANARKFMSEKALRRYNAERRIMEARRAQWHHAIAGNKKNAAAEECRSIFHKFKIDINDPRNAILLPVEPESIMRGTLHGKHVNSYDEYVLSRLKQALTQDQCFEIMDEIKKDLYKGHIQLLLEHKVNTALRTVTRKTMY